MIRYVLRDARQSDLEAILSLAGLLNSLNLPDQEEALVELLRISESSFSGALKDPFKRKYVFALEDLQTKKVIGTSQIVAQTGTLEEPLIFSRVYTDERYSESLKKLFRHKVMQLGYDHDGPSEVGGLVLDPRYRGVPDKLGHYLGFPRFMMMAAFPNLFRDRILAELMPPLLPNGRSLLWEALGQHFIGLGYNEADFLSRQNKEFIKSLYPECPFYISLFPPDVQAVIGAVGPETMPAKRMLESIGFYYSHRVDPFDGGPSYMARTNEVTIVRQTQKATLRQLGATEAQNREGFLVTCHQPFTEKASFFSVHADFRQDENGVAVAGEVLDILRAKQGETAWVFVG